MSASPVPVTSRAMLQGFVKDRAKHGAKVYTDEAAAYQGLPNHEAVRHSVGEYVRDMAHTNGLESFWALLKRGYHGTFHKMSPHSTFTATSTSFRAGTTSGHWTPKTK